MQLQDHGDDQENTSNNFTVVGLSGNKELPKHVAFKGDNGKYLGTKDLRDDFMVTDKANTPLAMDILGLGSLVVSFKIARSMVRQKYFQFHTEDIGHASVMFTTFTNDDGTVRITSSKGGVWKCDSAGWIVSDGDMEDKNDRNSLFEVVTGDGFVALRNLGNNKFCTRITADGRRTSCLRACDDSISQWAKLTLFQRQLVSLRLVMSGSTWMKQGFITNRFSMLSVLLAPTKPAESSKPHFLSPRK